MRPYRYTVDDAVLQTFSSVSKRHRERLLSIFNQLLADPFQSGDVTQRDQVGRPCQVKRFGEWTLTWWPEHLGNCIHIIAIEHLRI